MHGGAALGDLCKRPLHTLRTSWFGSKHFVVAYAVAILLFGVALPRSCEAMRRACLADMQCARRLTRDAYGWYDADDGQWRAYRGSFVTLLLAAGVTTALTRRIKAEKPTARLACGLAFVAVAHGGGAGCVVGVCGLFHAASFLPPALAVPAAWALALACLLAKDPALPYRRSLPAPRWPVLGAGMYAWPDALPLLVLRLVSHVVDAARARKQGTTTRPAGYDLQDCLAHALYAPLYVAGPVVAFDAFRNSKSKPISGSDVSYALRTLIVGGFLELVLRRCPAFALGASGAFRRLEAVDMAAFAFVTINVLWLSSASCGASRGAGRASTAWTRPRTWAASCVTTSPPRGSGGAGTGPLTGGSSRMCTGPCSGRRRLLQDGSRRRASCSRSWLCGTTRGPSCSSGASSILFWWASSGSWVWKLARGASWSARGRRRGIPCASARSARATSSC